MKIQVVYVVFANFHGDAVVPYVFSKAVDAKKKQAAWVAAGYTNVRLAITTIDKE